MRTRTYYESPEYESESEPGRFAALTIIGDHDGPHFVFSSGDQVILDLPVPVCEALAIRKALGRSVKHAMRANERLTDDWLTEADSAPPEPVMTPYGPREIPAGREVRGEPEPVSLPTGRRDTRELPRAADRFPEPARVGRFGRPAA